MFAFSHFIDLKQIHIEKLKTLGFLVMSYVPQWRNFKN
jgi:hypothetical protein